MFLYTQNFLLLFRNKRKKEEVRLSPMTKAPIPTENSKPPLKTSISQRLRTDLGRSVGVTTFIQLVWLNRFRVPNLPTNRNSHVIKRRHIFKNKQQR